MQLSSDRTGRVVDVRRFIDLTGFPGLTPRQINILAAGGTTAAGPHADFEPVSTDLRSPLFEQDLDFAEEAFALMRRMTLRPEQGSQ